MTGPLFRLLLIGVTALLLAAPLAAELPADPPENEEVAPGDGGVPGRGPDPAARLPGADASSVYGCFDATASSRSLSRPPPS